MCGFNYIVFRTEVCFISLVASVKDTANLTLSYMHDTVIFIIFATFNFILSSGPFKVITMSMSKDRVDVGNTLTLDCLFIDFKVLPNITWTLNNSVDFLTKSGVSISTTSSGTDKFSRLTFTNVNPAISQGNYSCYVANVVGNPGRKFEILVACELNVVLRILH